MNLALMPCCIKGCDRGAKSEVVWNGRVSYMCYTHALAIAEEAERRGITLNEDSE